MLNVTRRNDFEQRLIAEIYQRPLLYDKNNRYYRNRKKTANDWDTIAQKLGVDVPTCKTRWRSLRDVFYKKVKDAGGVQGLSDPETLAEAEAWPYFPLMRFLLEHEECNLDLGNCDGDQLQDHKGESSTEKQYIKIESLEALEFLEQELTEELETSPVCTENNSNVISTSSKFKRRKLIDSSPNLNAKPGSSSSAISSEITSSTKDTSAVNDLQTEFFTSSHAAFCMALAQQMNNLQDDDVLEFQIGTLQRLQELLRARTKS